jgi:ribonuclease G
MPKEMVISASPHETRVAILEDGQLCEIYVEREKEFALVGSIYKGRVTRVLPGMQSAFVDIGLDSDAFLYVSDFLEDIGEYDRVVTTVEEKVQKMEEQGGQVFAPAASAVPLEPPDVEPAPVPLEASQGAEPAEPARPAQSADAPAPPRFEQRRPEGRGYGHGRGQRRHGRRGGRGGDRRPGRDLPSSKYASHGSYVPRAEEPPTEAHEPVILPGESLAKYRARIPAAAQSSFANDAANAPAASPATPVESSSAREAEPPRVPSAESPADRASEFHEMRTGAGLEPLPGESISKARAHTEVREELRPEVEAPDPVIETEHAAFTVADPEAQEVSETPEIHPPAELSAEEANALAEQVAEAQSEEAEKLAAREGAGEIETEVTEEESGAEGAAELERISEGDEIIDPTGEMESAEAAVESAQIEAEMAEGVAPSAEEHGPDAESQPLKARVTESPRAHMHHPARYGRGRREDRGRRPQHGHRPQPRRPQLISELLRAGQEIIVQIAKEPLGRKGARITSHVALPGRYLVYMPTLDHTGVSRKIASAEERARLRHVVNEAKGESGGGFIVRTAAERATTEEIRADVEFLTRSWSDIKSRSEQRKAPALLHRDLNLVERILRDYLGSDYSAIWVDSEEEFTKVVEFVSRFQPQLANRVKLYSKETPVFEEFGIQQEIDKGLRPKVWLKSGGYIVINHTEALVAIDVNTGKFVGRGSTRLEDTIVRTNLEAVKEIVRQMRLRDLGGIIVIDFIDMEERRNREKVMAALEDALKADRAPSKVLRFNEFGLVAITRKRTKQALERTLCQPCPYCTGSGMVKSIPTLCYEIQAEARKMAPEVEAGSLTVRVHPEIAKALKTRESALMEELEQWTKKSVIIQSDPTLHWEQYDIY